MAKEHTVTNQKVTYNAKGNPVNTETLGTASCNCGANHDHTAVTQTVHER